MRSLSLSRYFTSVTTLALKIDKAKKELKILKAHIRLGEYAGKVRKCCAPAKSYWAAKSISVWRPEHWFGTTLSTIGQMSPCVSLSFFTTRALGHSNRPPRSNSGGYGSNSTFRSQQLLKGALLDKAMEWAAKCSETRLVLLRTSISVGMSSNCHQYHQATTDVIIELPQQIVAK